MNKDLMNILNGMFSQMTKDVLEVSPCRIEAQDFIKKLKKGEDILTLDIRTDKELEFTKFSYGKVLNISMNKLFIQENIDKLKTNQEIIVLCHSGARAIAIVTSLNLLGFKAVALKGGWISLSEALTIKEA